MEKQVAELLANVSGGEVREDYSGRGMCGRSTCGVTILSAGDMLGAILNDAKYVSEVVEDLEDEGIKIPEGFAMDSMGMDTIVY